MDNSVADVIRKLGWGVIIIGIITGFFAFWKVGVALPMKLSIAVTTWMQSLVGGFLLVGFSEAIEILDNINRKINK
jgi:hypothetical protein